MMIVRCTDGIDAKLIKLILNYEFDLMIRIILSQRMNGKLIEYEI